MSDPASSSNKTAQQAKTAQAKPQMTEWEKAIGQNDWMNELKRRQQVAQKKAGSNTSTSGATRGTQVGMSRSVPMAVTAAVVGGAGLLYFWPQITRGGRDLQAAVEHTGEKMVSAAKQQVGNLAQDQATTP